ncbi:MAG: GNAT family N-acetyltransferase [Verrucomicrobiota bacterium]|nr:GNAT family N-acetyltransferase [Verrucomicrobiota bacterium]
MGSQLSTKSAFSLDEDLVGLVSAENAVEILDPTETGRWDDMAQAHPAFTPFHSAGWARVLKKTYGHIPLFLRFHRQQKTVALLPLMEVSSRFTGRRGVSLPFSDFCDPLLWDDCNLNQIFPVLTTLSQSRRWKHCEIRLTASEGSGKSGRSFFHHTLALTPGLSAIWDQFGSANQRAIRKGAKLGLRIDVTKSVNALHEFFELHTCTRSRLGYPPQPLAFFINLHREMIATDQGAIVIARIGTRAIAGAVLLMGGKSAVYKFAASNHKFQSFRGNNLVLWEAIKFLHERDCSTLDLGRTDLADSGLRRFKLSWGTEEKVVSYVRIGGTKAPQPVAARPRSSWSRRIFARLPLAVNRLAGSAIYPHLD